MTHVIELWKQYGYCNYHSAPKCRPEFYNMTIPWAIHFHCGRNWDVLSIFYSGFERIPKSKKPDLYITIHDDQPDHLQVESEQSIDPKLREHINRIIWVRVPNCGADILPFLIVCEKVRSMNYLTILKLHAKKSNLTWFHTLVCDLMPSSEWIEWFLDCMSIQKELGMIVTSLDPLDYINFSYTIDLLLRAGIYIKPSIKSKMTPNNGILLDTYSSWQLHGNPLGFMNDNHTNIYLKLLSDPSIKQLMISVGTMFWIRYDICEQLLKRFPISIISQEFETKIIKDITWNKITHAWERFFSIYTVIQGYRIMTNKLNISFYDLPYHLIQQNFSSVNDISKHLITNQPLNNPVLITKQISNIPLFSEPNQPISMGIGMGTCSWIPTISIPSTMKQCVKRWTIQKWIDQTRIQTIHQWVHIWIPTFAKFIHWIEQFVYQEGVMITIWSPLSEVQQMIPYWTGHFLTWKLPLVCVEIMVEPVTIFPVYELLSQLSPFYQQNDVCIIWKQWTCSVPEPMSLSILLPIINTKKENIPFFGSSFLYPWIKQHFIETQKQLSIQNQNKITTQISLFTDDVPHELYDKIEQIEQIICLSATDLNQQTPFLKNHVVQFNATFLPCFNNNFYINTHEWIKKQKTIIQIYPVHPILEYFFHLHKSQNLIHESWIPNLRFLSPYIQSTECFTSPIFGNHWAITLQIIDDKLSNIIRSHGISIVYFFELYWKCFIHASYPTAVFYRFENNKHHWLILECFHKENKWMNPIVNQIRLLLNWEQIV